MSVAAEHVSKQFGRAPRRVDALCDVSLRVADGEFVCLVGPSGCGKTTLLRVLARLDVPTSGRVSWGTSDADTQAPHRSRPHTDSLHTESPHTALVFQQHALFPWLSLTDNVAIGLRLRGVPAAERRRRANAVLVDMGLGAFLDSLPHQLSGGMRQRANIARAVLANPRVLLMDEPLGGLDALTRVALQRELLAVWSRRRCAVLYVTHDIDEALRLGDRVVVMSGGDGTGGRIVDDIPVRAPRPRDLVRPLHEADADTKLRIWHLLEADVHHRLSLATVGERPHV